MNQTDRFKEEEKMARPSITDDCKTFLTALRRIDSIGNSALRKSLGWNEDRYWKVHAALIETDKIVKGRGRGGSVSRA
ncbi:MAG TPA: hypothetical protein VMU56_08550 [Beijerinckiaceae bacterium]|nr:hypothetical protein [Beijerinckiaceae bacterium]